MNQRKSGKPLVLLLKGLNTSWEYEELWSLIEDLQIEIEMEVVLF